MMLACRGPEWALLWSTLISSIIQLSAGEPWTPIVVKNVTELGPQLSPGVTDVSRDGGYSVLINGHIVWIYDDTECFDREGDQLSFVSNTAAYSDQPNKNVSTVADFGVVDLGKDKNGKQKSAILADKSVGTGGWIPFQPDELQFNKQKNGQERVAICRFLSLSPGYCELILSTLKGPGTSPTSISSTRAFLYAPLVYVDNKPQDPSKEYQARGMTLIAISAPDSGPIAMRQGDLIIPGTEVAFGGFSSLLGFKSTDATQDSDNGDRDIYLLGMTSSGLQLARVGVNDLNNYKKYTFYDPEMRLFTSKSPDPTSKDPKKVYLPGTYSSGSVFYSPYFKTFVMVYFNKMVDSTFYMRYLNLDQPLSADAIWVTGGKDGEGIVPEDAEALVKYAWSAEQKLWVSPTVKGFNYAGTAHPEFFNRQYFAPSLYPDNTSKQRRMNTWYGSNLVAEKSAGGDGKHLLLSWTAQLHSGQNNGIYQVQLAMLEFDDITPEPAMPTQSPSSPAAALTTMTSASSTKGGRKPVNTALNMIEKGGGSSLNSFLGYGRQGEYGASGIRGWIASVVGMVGIMAFDL